MLRAERIYVTGVLLMPDSPRRPMPQRRDACFLRRTKDRARAGGGLGLGSTTS
jgi:hypothetical protein